jgi:hypothetical protein
MAESRRNSVDFVTAAYVLKLASGKLEKISITTKICVFIIVFEKLINYFF